MNFSSESIKLKSKPQNEDFSFDLETPRGHFFAVLDFANHDYANLNATLKGKLETIVGSFVSLSTFSADLFLGFLAKEINNFLHNLGEQSGGPELLCSAALSIVSGDRFSYFTCGDVKIKVVRGGQLLESEDGESDQPETDESKEPVAHLGERHLETPLTNRVETINLQDDDVVLIMTPGLENGLEESASEGTLASSDAKEISGALLKAGASIQDDRTLVVIAGPYERQADPALADLSKAVASLEAKVSALTGSEDTPTSVLMEKGSTGDGQIEQRFSQQIEVLKDDLRGKAAKIDLLELDEKLKNLSVVLAGKADNAEVLGLQRDVLKLGLAANTSESVASKENDGSALADDSSAVAAGAHQQTSSQGSFSIRTALLILFIAIAGAFAGGWMQSRLNRKPPELWSVKTSGNQILISRVDAAGGQGSVAVNSPNALSATGEQTFSSFADVKQYIDTVNAPRPEQTPATAPNTAASPAVTEITLKPGDSLKRLAQQYNVREEKLKELNPTITRWPQIRAGQRVVVPAAPVPSPSPN